MAGDVLYAPSIFLLRNGRPRALLPRRCAVRQGRLAAALLTSAWLGAVHPWCCGPDHGEEHRSGGPGASGTLLQGERGV